MPYSSQQNFDFGFLKLPDLKAVKARSTYYATIKSILEKLAESIRKQAKAHKGPSEDLMH